MSKHVFLAKAAAGFTTAAFALSLANPAGAYTLQVPAQAKESLSALRTLLAQEGTFTPPPGDSGQFAPPPSSSGSFTPPPSGSTGQFQQQPFDQNQFGSNQSGPGQFGQQPQPNQQFQQFKEDVGPLQNNLNRFDSMVKDQERRGQPIPQTTKEKLERSKTTVDNVRNSQNPEEMQNFNTDQLEGDVQDLEHERRRLEQEKRSLQQMKKGMLQMEKGLKQFEAQIARLAKQKIGVPAEITETIAKIKTILAAVKAAKTFDEAEEAGIQDLQELMQSLDEGRQQLERLSRWPQTLQQVTREIKRLDTELKRAKTAVDRLKKQKIDLTDEYTAFAEAVKTLKDTIGVATTKVKSGNSEAVEEAFDMLENEFFGQMEEVFQHVQIIQTMSNLSRFAADLKRGLTQAQQRINQLKRQKIDTTELQAVYNEAKAKGDEVLALLKAKPVDSEAIQEGLQELENVKQQFEEMADEVSGQETALPWEGGKQQFQQLQLAPNVSKLIPQKPAAPTEEPFL